MYELSIAAGIVNFDQDFLEDIATCLTNGQMAQIAENLVKNRNSLAGLPERFWSMLTLQTFQKYVRLNRHRTLEEILPKNFALSKPQESIIWREWVQPVAALNLTNFWSGIMNYQQVKETFHFNSQTVIFDIFLRISIEQADRLLENCEDGDDFQILAKSWITRQSYAKTVPVPRFAQRVIDSGLDNSVMTRLEALDCSVVSNASADKSARRNAWRVWAKAKHLIKHQTSLTQEQVSNLSCIRQHISTRMNRWQGIDDLLQNDRCEQFGRQVNEERIHEFADQFG